MFPPALPIGTPLTVALPSSAKRSSTSVQAMSASRPTRMRLENTQS